MPRPAPSMRGSSASEVTGSLFWDSWRTQVRGELMGWVARAESRLCLQQSREGFAHVHYLPAAGRDNGWFATRHSDILHLGVMHLCSCSLQDGVALDHCIAKIRRGKTRVSTLSIGKRRQSHGRCNARVKCGEAGDSLETGRDGTCRWHWKCPTWSLATPSECFQYWSIGSVNPGSQKSAFLESGPTTETRRKRVSTVTHLLPLGGWADGGGA
ncbi:hypothetical protein CCHR01_05433 [Colletotrichum chrysophilum]|uniref:Uncharacterized protein n=1 Tax=Colletotrichum chrysophilum TaxID=1836956 RepID=A0AAD9AR28_9PEZI|nr:hypothetical protein CCHR01_05433 [Colletotrichum chrysophilum]